MILINLDKRTEYAKYENNVLISLDEEFAIFDGYYQYHKIGIVIFNLREKAFTINQEEFLFSQMDSLEYLVDGERRIFSIIYSDFSSHEFVYNEFWLDNIVMQEFAIGIPDDSEFDLIKIIVNHFKLYMNDH